MLSTDIKHLIPVDASSETPKYLQVSNGLIKAIEQRRLCKGDQLPSLRQLSDQLAISFDTAKKAYDLLKKRNIVVAAQGKSNVINATGPLPQYKIFLLFNDLSAHKEVLYDSFIHAFESPAAVDLYVYNDNKDLYRHLLTTRTNGYTHYVVIPYTGEGMQDCADCMDKMLSGKRLTLLHKRCELVKASYSCVHEDFENDIYSALKRAVAVLKKYRSISIIYPEYHSYPQEMITGFTRFCSTYSFGIRQSCGINTDTVIQKGEVFVTLSDEDLASLIEQLRIHNLVPGKDVGIISYNETPIKQVLFNGITTLSTDFCRMGKMAAAQITSQAQQNIAVPIKLNLRPSL